jgi:hypothetical protein
MGIKDWFKKNDTVIDLTNLQNRGIIKQTPVESVEPVGSRVTEAGSENTGSALGFLGNLAGASSGGSSVTSTEPSSLDTSAGFSSDRRTKLKGILRDMKARLDTSSDKIYKLSDRMALLERKIERLERRTGV